MPYILKEDYPLFEEGIRKIFEQIRRDTGGFRDHTDLRAQFSYFFYEVNRKTMPARRYWVMAEHGGIMHNIPDEVRRRLDFIKALRTPTSFPEYDSTIDVLAKSINRAAEQYNNKANPPGSYPGAYAGLVNFSLTSLLLRIHLAIAHEIGTVNLKLLKLMLEDMDDMALAFYCQIAGPYEDEQIAKTDTNGDLPEYTEIIRLIKEGRVTQ